MKIKKILDPGDSLASLGSVNGDVIEVNHI